MTAPQRFIHGTTYYHFANPPEELPRNFQAMREMGLNAVRVAEIWPGWECLEPSPGTYDFALLDDYVAKARAAGLSVIMGLGINNPPFWLFDEIPQLRCVDARGRVAGRRVQAANHDNPAYRQRMEAFIEAQAAHYAATEGLLAWQFGNEIRYGVDIPDDAATHERFRGWLIEQFDGDLDLLNRQWGTFYRDWEAIYPYASRFGAPTEGLSPLAIHTRRYKAWSLAELVEWGIGILRRHSALPVFHNNHSLPGDTYSHWDIAALGDVVVQDIYPTAGADPQAEATVFLDVAGSIARTLGKDLWIGETGIGQYGTFRRNRPARKQVEALVVEMLAAGAKAMLYFRHKAPRYEQPHKFTGSQSALRRDGSPMHYARTIEHVSKLMDVLGGQLLAAQPLTPAVAAPYPEESLRFSQDAGYRDLQRDAVYGTSALWNRLGIPIQWLSPDWLLEEDLSGYAMIYLPMSVLLEADVARRLAEYVRAGGTLVSELRPGYVDANGWLYEIQPGAGLHEVFGCREDLYWEAPSMAAMVGVGGRTHRCTFRRAFQSFRLQGGQTLARNDAGEIVAVSNDFGRGQAILLGFAPSLLLPPGSSKYQSGTAGGGVEVTQQQEALTLMRDLAAQASVAPPLDLETTSPHLSFRYLTAASGTLLTFIANHGPEAHVMPPADARVLARSLGDDLSLEPHSLPIELQMHDWCLLETPQPA